MSLLAVDIGNTNIVIGVFDGDQLVAHWRIATKTSKTEDEYGILVRDLFEKFGIDYKDIDGMIISSVVPPVQPLFEAMGKKYFKVKPMVVGPGIKTGMPILYDNPKEVGADRIVNAVAAYHAVRGAVLIVDFGTATTFDYVTPKGEYAGGAIFPGLTISLDALSFRTAKLPRVEFAKPPLIIAKNTVESIQAGIYFGYISMIEGMIKRIKAEVKTNPKVFATGGLAEVITKDLPVIDEIDEFLTLKGLKIIYALNSKSKKGSET